MAKSTNAKKVTLAGTVNKVLNQKKTGTKFTLESAVKSVRRSIPNAKESSVRRYLANYAGTIDYDRSRKVYIVR